MGLVEDFLTLFNEADIYFQESLLPGILAGDILSITVAGVLAIIIIALVFKVTGVVFALVRRLFLFLIIAASMFFFVTNFGDKIFTENPDPLIVGIGIIGVLLGIIALGSSLYSIQSTTRHWRQGTYATAPEYAEEQYEEYEEQPAYAPQEAQPQQAPHAAAYVPPPQQQPPQAQQNVAQYLTSQFTSDKNLPVILTYVAVAEFGIFSAVTLPAPSVGVGMALFAIILVGAIFYIRANFADPKKGYTNLAISTVFAFIMAIILGVVWVGADPAELISLNFFKSSSLVAVVTGIGVSLIMGSKG